MNKYIMYKV